MSIAETDCIAIIRPDYLTSASIPNANMQNKLTIVKYTLDGRAGHIESELSEHGRQDMASKGRLDHIRSIETIDTTKNRKLTVPPPREGGRTLS